MTVSKGCLWFLPVMNMANSSDIDSTNFVSIFWKLFQTTICFESIYNKLNGSVGNHLVTIAFNETGECLFDSDNAWLIKLQTLNWMYQNNDNIDKAYLYLLKWSLLVLVLLHYSFKLHTYKIEGILLNQLVSKCKMMNRNCNCMHQDDNFTW